MTMEEKSWGQREGEDSLGGRGWQREGEDGNGRERTATGGRGRQREGGDGSGALVKALSMRLKDNLGRFDGEVSSVEVLAVLVRGDAGEKLAVVDNVSTAGLTDDCSWCWAPLSE